MTELKKHIHREITPLKKEDCFLVIDRKRNLFNYPIHFHPEYELNYIYNAKGGRRIVGDHIGEIGQRELVLTGPNLYHGWENYKNDEAKDFHEVTIQFAGDVFDHNLLERNLLNPLKTLFQKAKRGVLFSKEATKQVEKKILKLSKTNGFDSFLQFQSLLYDLAISRDQAYLTNMSFQNEPDFYNNERIEKIYAYLKENYHRIIRIDEAASLVNMSVISFGRLIKHQTGKSFTEFLIEVRLGSATRRLIESNESITEICFDCGFNNISNFNRIFKKYQNCTPSEFRSSFKGVKSVY